jgi:hypothetical protein
VTGGPGEAQTKNKNKKNKTKQKQKTIWVASFFPPKDWADSESSQKKAH